MGVRLMLPSLLILTLAATGGCSVRKMAINSLADALAGGAAAYASDSDLDLVREAMPFGLKTIESLLVEVPRHRGLLLAASSGFTQYAYLAVELEAEEVRDSNPDRSKALRLRAKELYLRGRDYGFRALDLRQPGFRELLERDADSALAPYRRENVEEIYWTAVAWSAAISTEKEDLELVADLHLIEPFLRKCLDLDEAFDQGAVHEFLIAFEGSRSEAQGGSSTKAREHFERAVQLSGGRRLGPLVSLAENVSVAEEDLREFSRVLRQVLGFDLDRAPEHRLANLVAQRRARLLLSRIDELFIDLSPLDDSVVEGEIGSRTGARE
jgi:hypothetical protein